MDSQTIFEWSPRTGTRLSLQVLSSDPENTKSLSVCFNCNVPIELFLSADVIPKYEWTFSISAATGHPLAMSSSLSKARQKRTFWIPKKDDKSLRKVMSSGILNYFPLFKTDKTVEVCCSSKAVLPVSVSDLFYRKTLLKLIVLNYQVSVIMVGWLYEDLLEKNGKL